MDEDLPRRVRLLRRSFADVDGALDDEIARKRGILTTDDREFLLRGPDDRSERAIKGKEQRIRQRVRNTILDLSLLHGQLSDEDREYIFMPGGAANESKEELLGGAIFTLAFLYDGIERTEYDFEDVLDTAIEHVERRGKEGASSSYDPSHSQNSNRDEATGEAPPKGVWSSNDEFKEN